MVGPSGGEFLQQVDDVGQQERLAATDAEVGVAELLGLGGQAEDLLRGPWPAWPPSARISVKRYVQARLQW